jgi:hypothetical protein
MVALCLVSEQLQQTLSLIVIPFFADLSYWEVRRISKICTKKLCGQALNPSYFLRNFEILSVFPMTVRLLANIARTAMKGFNAPPTAKGIPRTL